MCQSFNRRRQWSNHTCFHQGKYWNRYSPTPCESTFFQHSTISQRGQSQIPRWHHRPSNTYCHTRCTIPAITSTPSAPVQQTGIRIITLPGCRMHSLFRQKGSLHFLPRKNNPSRPTINSNQQSLATWSTKSSNCTRQMPFTQCIIGQSNNCRAY